MTSVDCARHRQKTHIYAPYAGVHKAMSNDHVLHIYDFDGAGNALPLNSTDEVDFNKQKAATSGCTCVQCTRTRVPIWSHAALWIIL
jgi:hypothetical protein